MFKLGYWRICQIVLVIALLAGARGQAGADPERPDWQKDLEFFRQQAPLVHKNLFHTLSWQKFDQQTSALARDSQRLSRPEVVVRLGMIVAQIGDGHTYIDYSSDAVQFRQLPISLYQFSDGLYVAAAAPSYQHLAGAKVITIGGYPAEEAFKIVSQLASHDSPMQTRWLTPELMTVPEILQGLHIVKDSGSIPLVIEKNGTQSLVTVAPMDQGQRPMLSAWNLPKDWTWAVDAKVERPLWTRSNKLFGSTYLEDARVLHVQFNGVYPDGDQTPGAFFRQLLQSPEAAKAERLVIDVRLNTGGNNAFNLPIIHSFIRSDKFNQRGKLFVIIGRQTFSAAQNFVNQMQIHTNAIFAGEPTAGRPNHYGDPETITLPNSHIQVRFSTLWWQDMGPRDSREWLTPGLAADLSYQDFRRGHDPVLQAVIDFGKSPSLAMQLRQALAGNDLAAAGHAMDEFQSNPLYRYRSLEDELLEAGQESLNQQRPDEALAIYAVAAGRFPHSARPYDAIAELHLRAGRIPEAVQAYEHALLADPQDGQARAMLRRLKR